MALDVALMYWLVFHVLHVEHATKPGGTKTPPFRESSAANRRTPSPAADIGSARNSRDIRSELRGEGSSERDDESL
jgi:hypothetical protein